MSNQSSGAQAANKPKIVPVQAVTQAVPFPAGIYRFFVRTASPVIEATVATPFPALLVACAPGTPAGVVEFAGNSSAVSAWLCNAGDVVVAKINGKGASLILSSMRTAADTQPLDIQVEQVTSPAVPRAANAAAPSLKLRVGVHLRGQGDVQFSESEWAGRAGSGAWIEALSIAPQEVLGTTDLEYKGLAGNGFESPWLSGGAICGTKGAGVPLIGFAIRLKPALAAQYEVEYSAYFRSGLTVGPLRNGVPCRSKAANDPLEALQVRVVKREKPAVVAAGAKPAAAEPASKVPSKTPAKQGPSFSKFRDEEEDVSALAKKKDSKPAAPEKAKVAAPVSKPAAKTTAVKPVPKPAAKPAAKPVVKPIAKPAAKPASGAAAKARGKKTEVAKSQGKRK